MLSITQRRHVKRLADKRGVSVSAVIRDAVDAYLDNESAIRREAAERLLAMNAPVDDWDVMKAQIVEGRYGELRGWKP